MSRSCTDCMQMLLTFYPRCFEHALCNVGDERRMVFHACHSYENGDNEKTHDSFFDDNCLRVVIAISGEEIRIGMRSTYSDIVADCSCSLEEAEEQIAAYGSNRMRLAFRRLTTTTSDVQ